MAGSLYYYADERLNKAHYSQLKEIICVKILFLPNNHPSLLI